VVVFLAVRTWIMGWDGDATVPRGDSATVAQALLFGVKIFLTSLGQWFWPTALAVDHGWPITIGTTEGALLAAGGVAVVLLTIVAARVDRLVGWCLVWFWAGLAPVGALPFVSRLTLYQDHRVYLSGIALAWLAGRLAVLALRRGERIWFTRPVLGVLVLGLGVSAVLADVRQTAVWVDPIHLWNDVLAKYPDSVLALDTQGILYLQDGKLDEAQRAFERVIELVPGFSAAHYGLGGVFSRRGNWEQAAVSLESALAIAPKHRDAALLLAKSHEQLGQPDRALDRYQQIVDQDPSEMVAWARSGLLLERAGRLEDAAERYRTVLALDRNDDQARAALGGVLLRLERWAEARAVFDALAARHEDSYPMRFNLGAALDGLGRLDEALAAYRAAAALKPRDPDPHVRVALIHAKRGRWLESASEYDAALARDPDHFESHMNLALVAERLGDAPRAVSHYRAFVATSPADPVYDGPRAQARGAIARLQGGTLPRKAEDAPRGAGRG
jgi:tetratricopeptide (TPR) repeat protein